jgi:glycosyltransferase involved in cell wall biosynthesis
MKILHIINSLAGGGAEKLVAELSVLMNSGNDTCSVLILTDSLNVYKEKLESQGVLVYSLNEKKINSLSCFKAICSFLKNNDYDIINAHLFPTLYYVSLYSFFYKDNAKFIFTEHNTYNNRRKHKAFRIIEKFIYSRFDKIICISEGTEKALKTWTTLKDYKKIATINNGINLSDYYNADPYSKDMFFSDNNKILCMVGSVTEQKNHELFLDIIKELPSEYSALVVGDGPLLEKVKAKSHLLNIDNRILFLGYRTDVASIMKASDIVVIPSKWEGFGLIAIEAMAIGKPVICSNVDGLKEVVGDVGFVENNKEEYISDIMKLEYSKNYEEASNRSKERALLFSLDKMNKNYLELYKDLL